jgi:hypothetical protein
MKKLINAVDDVIKEQLQGMALAHPELTVNIDPRYIYRADAPVKGKVALVSGGGSGHEPMHGGFVGLGMLDGACPGEIFTSPTPDQMYECAKAVDSGAGVLFIVKNYTGDVLNFETAAELVHAEGIKVQNILIDDDVAVKDSLYTAGRRGVGTTVLAEKIVGAAAESQYNLEQCAALCRKVNQCGRSMGMALTSCTVPAAGKPTFELGDDEIDLYLEPNSYLWLKTAPQPKQSNFTLIARLPRQWISDRSSSVHSMLAVINRCRILSQLTKIIRFWAYGEYVFAWLIPTSLKPNSAQFYAPAQAII